MCLCLKFPKDEVVFWGSYFFAVLEEIVYSFFDFLFDILWNSTNLASVPQLGSEDLVYDDLFTSQREFLTMG